MGNVPFFLNFAWLGFFTLKIGGAMSLYIEALQDMYCTVVVAMLALQCGQARAFAVNLPNVPTYCRDIWFILWSGLEALHFLQMNLNMLQEYI